ncbi:DUF3742 family protein [Pseudomonas putida]|uniref:DUF3742 family protein n=1 Tax=Pseudomonas putida TaxID=303 RepID=UPI003CC7EB37
MAGNTIVSRGGAFGRRVAAGLKRLMALERDLIERAGRWSGTVKWGLHLIRLSIALSLVSLTLWALIVVLPFVLIVWLVVACNERTEEASSWRCNASDHDSMSGYGYRDGWEGYGLYVGEFRIDSGSDVD